jgi:hypothetical protein
MLRLAEGEIRAKDEQISLLHKMVGANEDEIAARGRIEEQAEARQLPVEAHQTRDARLARAHQD